MDDTDDNPWANAAANNETNTKSTFQVDPPEEWNDVERATRQELEEVDPDSCGFKTLYQGLQLWHLFDLLMGLVVVLYGSIMASSVADVVVALILGVGILLLVRAASGALALSTEDMCHRCGLPISSRTSPILACLWFVLMLVNLVVPGHVKSYLEQHHMLWSFLQRWEGGHKHTLTLLLLGAFLLECARWQLVQSLQRKLNSLEAREDARARERSALRNRVADRPWWFGRRSMVQNDDPLTDSLLPVNSGQPIQSATHSWTFFGRPRRTHREYQNVRDDASVDFASVQEEWASRTEEDPYWWSRDEDSSLGSGDKRGGGR